MLPKVDERRPGRQGTANDSGGDTRKQNLLTMCNPPDARRPVNVRSTIISVRFAGVNSHSNAQRNMGWPRFQAKSALNRTSRRDRIACPLENREHTVAFASFQNDRPVMRQNTIRDDLVVPRQRDTRLRRIRFPGAR